MLHTIFAAERYFENHQRWNPIRVVDDLHECPLYLQHAVLNKALTHKHRFDILDFGKAGFYRIGTFIRSTKEETGNNDTTPKRRKRLKW